MRRRVCVVHFVGRSFSIAVQVWQRAVVGVGPHGLWARPQKQNHKRKPISRKEYCCTGQENYSAAVICNGRHETNQPTNRGISNAWRLIISSVGMPVRGCGMSYSYPHMYTSESIEIARALHLEGLEPEAVTAACRGAPLLYRSQLQKI